MIRAFSSGECACADSPPGPMGYIPEHVYRFERVLDEEFELTYVRVYTYGIYSIFSESVFSSHFFVICEASGA